MNRNLRRNNAFFCVREEYYADGNLSLIVQSTMMEDFDFALCKLLIKNNTLADPTLPPFKYLDIPHFLLICTYYQFDQLLEKTVKYCLNEGLHDFTTVFRALESIHGTSDYWVQRLVQGFEYQWDTHQSSTLSNYLKCPMSDKAKLIPLNELLACKFKESIEILPGLARALIQSPYFRMQKIFFPVCPTCELYVTPMERVLTSCCYEPIHESCQWGKDACEICLHQNSKYDFIPTHLDLGINEKIADRKYKFWHPCPVVEHNDCYIYCKDVWISLKTCGSPFSMSPRKD